MEQTRKESAAYLTITFTMTWLLWLAALAVSGTTCTQSPSVQWLIRVGTAVPSLTGLFLAYRYGGSKGVRALWGTRLGFWGVVRYLPYTFLLFPATLVAASVMHLLAGGSLPPSQFPVRFIPWAFFYILVFMGPLGEELGWRGFLLGRLLRQWGILAAGGLLGVVWSLWHLPLFFLPGTIQNELAKMGPWLAGAGYLVYTTCISLLLTVLYARTRGSLLLCITFHTVCNLSLGVVPLILSESGAAVLLATLVLTTTLVLKISEQGNLNARR